MFSGNYSCVVEESSGSGCLQLKNTKKEKNYTPHISHQTTLSNSRRFLQMDTIQQVWKLPGRSPPSRRGVCWSSSVYLRSPADPPPLLLSAGGVRLLLAAASLILWIVLLLFDSHPLRIFCRQKKRYSLSCFKHKPVEGGQGLTFGELQVKGVVCLLHVTPRGCTLYLVPQLLQLDVEMNFILCSWELCTARTGRGHQVTHLRRKTSQNRSHLPETSKKLLNAPSQFQGLCRAAGQIPGF